MSKSNIDTRITAQLCKKYEENLKNKSTMAAFARSCIYCSFKEILIKGIHFRNLKYINYFIGVNPMYSSCFKKKDG